MLLFSATKGSSLKEEWIAYIAREILRVRPNKKISLFRVTGWNILGRVGLTFFFFDFFFWIFFKILCILKGISPFKMHKIVFFFWKT